MFRSSVSEIFDLIHLFKLRTLKIHNKSQKNANWTNLVALDS